MKVEDSYTQIGNHSDYIIFWKLQSWTVLDDIFETLIPSLHDNACIVISIFYNVLDFRNKRMIK
jgi:hypothetical protein